MTTVKVNLLFYYFTKAQFLKRQIKVTFRVNITHKVKELLKLKFLRSTKKRKKFLEKVKRLRKGMTQNSGIFYMGLIPETKNHSYCTDILQNVRDRSV